MYPNLVQTKIRQLAFSYFTFICIISQRYLILVSSEDMSNIPLSLYETKFLADSEIRTSSDAKLSDSYKRSGNSAFYGLRGKKQSDSLEINDDVDKRGAFYPVRGKKKLTAFTALRGKKILDVDNVGENKPFLNEDNNTTLSQFLTNLKNDNDAWNAGVAKVEAILSEEMQQPSHSDDSRSQIPDATPVSWENILHKEKIFYDPMGDSRENSWTDNNKYLAEVLSANEADDLANDSNDISMDKRRTSGFTPMRGRKSDLDAQFYNDKRRSAFIPMRGRKSDLDAQFYTDKRRSAFTPMRGRKSDWDTLFYTDKRRSAFIPMRGRKSDLDGQLYANKRKSAFIPMRGRRAYDDDDDSSSVENAEFPNNPVSIEPLTRSRRSIWNQNGVNQFDQHRRVANQISSYNSRWPQGKRVAFHAVRGKKYSLPLDWHYFKRAFHASRGKKLDDLEEEGESNEESSSYIQSSDEERPESISESKVKRSIQRKMTRGKSRSTLAIKRPLTFFATRGKRFGENAVETPSTFLLV